MEYQIWDTIQAFASSITTSFATQSVLKGYGVGDVQASLLAATVTWLMKDGLGKVARIWFAWFQGFFADIMYDISIFLEIMAAMYKPAFFVLLCMAGVCLAIVSVAGEATRSALKQHQARRNNLADVSAKDGSQETMVNMTGLLVSILLAPLVSENPILMWILFTVLTTLHLYANWCSMRAVTMETLNQARFHFVAQSFLSTHDTLMSVREANLREPVFGKLKRNLLVNFGYSLGKVVESYAAMKNLISIYGDSKYLLAFHAKTCEVFIVLHEEASVGDELEVMLQAELLDFCHTPIYGRPKEDSQQLDALRQAMSTGDEHAILTLSRKLTATLFPHFHLSLEKAGWTTTHTLFNADEWRATWERRKEV